MAEFPFEFSPILQAEYETNPELKVRKGRSDQNWYVFHIEDKSVNDKDG